jgi:UDP-N-acetylglucosamine 2-epimerase (non-hydrolysing)
VRVAVFVGTRADLGPLLPVLQGLADARAETVVLTGVAFDETTLTAALQTAFGDAHPAVVALAPPVEVIDAQGQLKQAAIIAGALQDVLASESFDRLVVLGDRWELLSVVPPFFLSGVPIVHLHGGEVTEGAIDERVRHAITKLADVHCVASEDAAERVRQLGEPADRIHVTGAPGLDRFAGIEPLGDAALADLVGRPVIRPLALFTYHPPTAAPAAQIRRWAADALAATVDACGTVIATHPGYDVGRDEILDVLIEAYAAHDNLVVIEALGPRYPAVLAASDVVVGNSSSGVIEAASVGVPAVDIGDRQRGRLRGANVVATAEGLAAVGAALQTALSAEFRAQATNVVNPYGDGTAGRLIAAIVLAAAPPRAKPFIDVRP